MKKRSSKKPINAQIQNRSVPFLSMAFKTFRSLKAQKVKSSEDRQPVWGKQQTEFI
jgi:hypothetical protein